MGLDYSPQGKRGLAAIVLVFVGLVAFAWFIVREVGQRDAGHAPRG